MAAFALSLLPALPAASAVAVRVAPVAVSVLVKAGAKVITKIKPEKPPTPKNPPKTRRRKKKKRTRYLYHYTRLNAIPDNISKGLRASIKDDSKPDGDARYGSGIYLTDLTPAEIATGTRGQHSYALYKIGYKWQPASTKVGWIRINVQGLNVRKVAALYGQKYAHRGNYLVSRTTSLPLTKRLGGTGQVVYSPNPIQNQGGQ